MPGCRWIGRDAHPTPTPPTGRPAPVGARGASRVPAGFGSCTLRGFAGGWGGAVLGASLYLGVDGAVGARAQAVLARADAAPGRRDPARVRARRARRRNGRGAARRAGADRRRAGASTGADGAPPSPTALPSRGRRPVDRGAGRRAARARAGAGRRRRRGRRRRQPRRPPWPRSLLLDVKGRAPKTGYDRDQYGQAWKDVDRNGCDTRNDILRRDLTAIVAQGRDAGLRRRDGHAAGPVLGPGDRLRARRRTRRRPSRSTTSSPCRTRGRRAPRRGTPTRREAFANDPLNLLAVDGPLNMQKGDGDAATWLPPNKAYRCAYVARQVGVKYTYGLWVTQAERDAMVRVLSTCPDEPLPDGSTVPPRAVVDAPAPAPAGARAPRRSCRPGTGRARRARRTGTGRLRSRTAPRRGPPVPRRCTAATRVRAAPRPRQRRDRLRAAPVTQRRACAGGAASTVNP